jgi:hypothetical protein
MPSEIPHDLALIIGDRTAELIDHFAASIRPPSSEPIWRWAEQHIELSAATSDIPGPISYELFPASKIFFDHAQNPRTRRITVMASAQSGKTEDVITLLLWTVKENPMPTMWAMAVADQCEEFAKDRLYPAFQNCKPVFALAPNDRRLWTKRMIKFDTMTLHLRGSNSKAKLQSSPVGRIICDERREWRPGSIQTIRKRTMTFAECQEISMGVAGEKNGELHIDWLEGSQTFIHWRCLKCGHGQPWRFGRKPSILFPEMRTRGGIVWPTDDRTKPDGRWELEAVEKLARYECENCGELYESKDKGKMLATTYENHRNERALPAHFSMHRTALMMPWESCGFGQIAVRFLKAMSSMKVGDLEPLRTFVTEDLGEPFEPPQDLKQKGQLLDRIGDYSMGQCWWEKPDPKLSIFVPGAWTLEKGTALILTFDRQLMYLRYVLRQWRSHGESRLIDVGKVASLDDLRAKQLSLKIRDQCVWGDDAGPGVADFRQTALRWQWNVIKGEDSEYFTITRRDKGVDKSFRQGWRETSFDPGIGTTREGRAVMRAFLWSNPWYKDKLYFLFIPGRGPLWEIPKDCPADYHAEMNANEWREKENAAGQIEGYFHEAGADHAADCELSQLVVADIGNLTRLSAAPPKA